MMNFDEKRKTSTVLKKTLEEEWKQAIPMEAVRRNYYYPLLSNQNVINALMCKTIAQDL